MVRPAGLAPAPPRWQRGVLLLDDGREYWPPRPESNRHPPVQGRRCFRYTTGQWWAREESNLLVRRRLFYRQGSIPLLERARGPGGGRTRRTMRARHRRLPGTCRPWNVGGTTGTRTRTSALRTRRTPLIRWPLVEPAGIEPAPRACHARVLPLDDGPVVPPPGIAPGLPDLQTGVRLLHQGGGNIGWGAGNRTPTCWSRASRAAITRRPKAVPKVPETALPTRFFGGPDGI